MTLYMNVELDTWNFEHFNPIPPPVMFYAEQVENSGCTLSELVQQIGYKNINKGIRRLKEWMENNNVPNSKEGNAFLKLLGTSRDEINRLEVARQQRIDDSIIYTKSRVAETILTHNAELLLKHATEIRNNPIWSSIHIPGIGGWFAWVPSRKMDLGQLVWNWDQEILRRGDEFFLSVSGSPLSGVHSAVGFNKNAPDELFRASSLFDTLGPNIKHFRRAGSPSDSDADWSIGQLVTHLGGSVPPTEIFVEHTCIGIYHHKTQKLRLHNQEYDCHPHLYPSTESVHKQSKNTLKNVTLYQQNLQVNGRILCHWTGDLPPIVAQEIALQFH